MRGVRSVGERIKAKALDLTKVLSVVGTRGEGDAARWVYAELQKIEYFMRKPENLFISPIEGDPLGRCNVVAIIEGKQGKAKDTVLCLGHIDTVGISDYAELADYANQPDAIKEKLKKGIQFTGDTAADLNSDNWIFGRGLFDMKTGVAALMVMLEEFAPRAEELERNLVFIAVADEEGSSAGMLDGVVRLRDMARQKEWEFIAAVDTDYMTNRYPGDEKKYVYIGTVGKLLPSFYIYGEEAHVGEAFNGLDPNLLASELLYQIDLSADLCDVAEDEVTLPPVSLHQRDLKTEYSVQTANAVTMYFNYATHSSQPDEVLVKCRDKAVSSFDCVIKRLNEEYGKYCRLSGMPEQPLPWKTQVLTYEELYRNVKGEIGDRIDELIDRLAKKLMAEGMDDREFSRAIVEEVHRHYSDQNSKIIVYFGPPYYPHIYVKGEEAREKRLLEVIGKAVEAARSQFSYDIVVRKFYPYISDLSYCSISKDEASIGMLTRNMPAWQRSYSLPVEAIREISMPVVNIGPFGRDAHKLSERISQAYTFDAMPFILQRTLEDLLK